MARPKTATAPAADQTADQTTEATRVAPEQAQPPETGNDGAVTDAGEGAAAPSPVTAAPAPDLSELPRPELPPEAAIQITQGDDDQTGPDGCYVMVKGPAAGRWRAGRFFGPEVTTIPANELTAAQMRLLLADPALMVKTDP